MKRSDLLKVAPVGLLTACGGGSLLGGPGSLAPQFTRAVSCQGGNIEGLYTHGHYEENEGSFGHP
jgi:hypothetical protein